MRPELVEAVARERGALELLDEALIAQALQDARKSARQRSNYNFHPRAEDNPHRFINAMCRGTYVTPHRHQRIPKSETFLVLRGRAAFFLFDDHGRIETTLVLGPDRRRCDALGVDLQPGHWHTLAVLSREVVCFEVKPGPYDPITDKEFAPWAPEEGSPEAPAYLAWLVAEHRRLAARS